MYVYLDFLKLKVLDVTAIPILLSLVVNGSVAVFVGENVVVKEDVRVMIDCSQLIDAIMDNRVSNTTITWYKDGFPITNGSALNVKISADYRHCIITNTLLALGGRQLRTDGDYTCGVCNITTCINKSSSVIICGM